MVCYRRVRVSNGVIVLRIQIPFRSHFKQAIIQGRKIATSRTRKYGKPGDEFEAFGYVFVIERQERISLGVVAYRHYQAEGFDTPEQFKNEWMQIHQQRGYDSEQKVWMHWFGRKGVRHKPHFVPEEKQMELGREWLTDSDIAPGIKCNCEVRNGT